MRVNEDWRQWMAELAHSHISADAIALGGALGTLIAIFPTPGFNILIGLLFLAAFPRINKVALFGALAFWNPLVCAPLYGLAYGIGDMLFGSEVVVKYQIVLLDQVYNFSRRFLVGIAIIDVFCTLIVYAVLWSAVTLRRRHN